MIDRPVNDNTRLVLAALHAVEQRDVRGLLDLYHPDVEFHDAPSLPYGGVVRGKTAVEAHMYSGWAATWGPLQPTAAEQQMDPQVVAANEDEVVVLYHQRAVGPAGEGFDAPVLALYKVRDGKLIRAQMFHFDTAAVVGFLARANGATVEPSA
jgi:ketosteroid isomerase-like protein